MNATTRLWRAVTPDVYRGLGALWGKSGQKGGTPNLLLQHLIDTSAVAELLWENFLALRVREQLDRVTDGRGRQFLAWLCGAHDLGKATPAFQGQVPELARRVQAAGLGWGRLGTGSKWRHERASARIIDDAAARAGWSRASRSWVWPLLAGHHGIFPPSREIRPPRREMHGGPPAWTAVQESLVELITTWCGYADLTDVEPSACPPRAFQLALSGFVIMADWIASDAAHFKGVDDIAQVTADGARERAARAWATLGLEGGWTLAGAPDDPVRRRFGIDPRPGQQAVVSAAAELPGPGLVIVEAPTGEGKTEAALAAAEVLSSRFGFDGVFVGMPTQATSDPMLDRVAAWAGQLRPGIQVALLHGRRHTNARWRALSKQPDQAPGGEGPVRDEYGVADDFCEPRHRDIDEAEPAGAGVSGAEQWLLGRKRGLLAPVVVGTIDQLLFAATRSKHVALRFAGLVGKVVILDEVHAADIYMQQFVREALWWLGQSGTPVILLSATLGPAQRRAFVQEYIGGASGQTVPELPDVDGEGGYPKVVTACLSAGEQRVVVTGSSSWRAARRVGVEVLDDAGDDPSDTVVPYVEAVTAGGGCVLVVVSTVRRAQSLFNALRHVLPDDVVLLHSRLTAADRAVRTERVLSQLGPDQLGRQERPHRLVVVATQVAEQSFDIDADLLVTDIAPVDLLVQRAGRLHRHQRAGARPLGLAVPRVVVTGMQRVVDAPPTINEGILAVYGEARRAVRGGRREEDRAPYRAAAPLLRSAAQVEHAARDGGWTLPAQVPELVDAAYGDALVTPERWHMVEQEVLEAFRALQSTRARRAQGFRLAPDGARTEPTLGGIHARSSTGHADEDELLAAVRDSEQGTEVILVESVEGRYRSPDGHDFGVQGERIREPGIPEAVVAGSVRLPATWPALTDAAARLGPALPEWRDHPWTKHSNVLVLRDAEAELAGFRIRYDRELGLLVEPSRGTPARAGTT